MQNAANGSNDTVITMPDLLGMSDKLAADAEAEAAGHPPVGGTKPVGNRSEALRQLDELEMTLGFLTQALDTRCQKLSEVKGREAAIVAIGGHCDYDASRNARLRAHSARQVLEATPDVRCPALSNGGTPLAVLVFEAAAAKRRAEAAAIVASDAAERCGPELAAAVGWRMADVVRNTRRTAELCEFAVDSTDNPEMLLRWSNGAVESAFEVESASQAVTRLSRGQRPDGGGIPWLYPAKAGGRGTDCEFEMKTALRLIADIVGRLGMVRAHCSCMERVEVTAAISELEACQQKLAKIKLS